MIEKIDLDKIDKSGMYKIYDSWPEIAEENYNRVKKKNNLDKPSHIIFAGMGGSGAISDVFAAILSKTNIHVEIVKGYRLPKTASKETRVIATSVSGNTVETLNVLTEAKKIDCKIIAFSNGGKMEKICKEELIEFRKINPAKYRLRIHGARANFPIILSERFHSGWKAYLVPWKNNSTRLLNDSTIGFLSEYQVLKGNEDNQANSQELKDFLSQGWISDLQNKQTEEITLNTLITRLENIQTSRKLRKTDFISKNYFGSIQNNNLPANSTWETWFPRDILLFCSNSQKSNQNCDPTFSINSINKWRSNVLQWPDLLHWQINSFANSWWIDTNFIRQIPLSTDTSSRYYHLNQNGSVDFEIVLEFWPQRLFYMGGVFSITLFFSCVTALVLRSLFRFIKNRSISQHHSSVI